MNEIVLWGVLGVVALVILYLWVMGVLHLYFRMRRKHHLNLVKHLKEEGECQ